MGCGGVSAPELRNIHPVINDRDSAYVRPLPLRRAGGGIRRSIRGPGDVRVSDSIIRIYFVKSRVKPPRLARSRDELRVIRCNSRSTKDLSISKELDDAVILKSDVLGKRPRFRGNLVGRGVTNDPHACDVVYVDLGFGHEASLSVCVYLLLCELLVPDVDEGAEAVPPSGCGIFSSLSISASAAAHRPWISSSNFLVY